MSDTDNTTQIPRVYVDAADFRVQPHSFHMILGALDLEGEPVPVMHITVSPRFATELSRALSAAVAMYAPERDVANEHEGEGHEGEGHEGEALLGKPDSESEG